MVLVAAACFSISTALLTERKAHTLAFHHEFAGLAAGFLSGEDARESYSVAPFLIMLVTLLVILYTPLPDGLIVYSTQFLAMLRWPMQFP